MLNGTIAGLFCIFLGLNKCMQRNSKICGFGCEFLVTIILINVPRNCSLIDRDHSDGERILRSIVLILFFFVTTSSN